MQDNKEKLDEYIVAKPIKDIKNVFSSMFGGISAAEMIIAGICALIAIPSAVGLFFLFRKINKLASVLVIILWLITWIILTCCLIGTSSKNGLKRWQNIAHRFKFWKKDNKSINKVSIQEATHIKEIKDGVVHLAGKKIVKFYKLSGINIDLLSNSDSNRVVSIAERPWYNNDMTGKFIIVDEPFDIESHDKYIQSLIDKSNDETEVSQLCAYGEQNDTVYNSSFLSKGVYFAICAKDEKEIHSFYVHNLAPLASANINVREIDDNETIVNTLLPIFSCQEKPYWNPDGTFNYDNFKNIKFDKNIYTNGQGVSSIVEIKQLPNFVLSGWMKILASFQGVEAIVSVYPAEKNSVVQNFSRAKRRLKNNWSYIRNEGEQVNSTEYFEAYDSLISNIATGGLAPWYVNIQLVFNAPDKKSLIELQKEVKKALKNDKWKINELDYQQKQAFESLFSFRYGYAMKKQTLSVATNDVLAAAFPFNSNAINDAKGLYFGDDAFSGTPFFLDFKFKDNDKRNSNVFTICGQVGGGKSYCTKHIINWLRNTGCKQFIIAPTDDYFNFAEHYDKVKIINVVDKKHGLINPLQIFDNNKTIRMHINTFIGWLSLLCETNFDETDQRMMTEILNDLYKSFDIKEHSAFIDIPNNKWPTGNDLYEFTLKRLAKSQHPRAGIIIDRFWLLSSEGTYGHLWNGHTSINVKNDNMVIFYTKDISSDNAKDKILMDGTMYLLFNFINSELQKNLEHNNKITNVADYSWISVIVDEAHRLINRNNPIALKALIAMAKEIRHYQGILINVTQSISDFKNGGGEDIIKQSLYHIIFNLSGADISDYEEMLKDVGGLTEKGKEFISAAPRGDALITIGNHYRGFVSVHANEQNSAMWEVKKTGFSK